MCKTVVLNSLFHNKLLSRLHPLRKVYLIHAVVHKLYPADHPLRLKALCADEPQQIFRWIGHLTGETGTYRSLCVAAALPLHESAPASARLCRNSTMCSQVVAI